MSRSSTSQNPSPTNADGVSVALRACAFGAVGVAVATALVCALAPAELLPDDVRTYMLAGAFAGALTGTLGNVMVARGALGRPVDPRSATAFLRAIVFDTVLQFGAVAAGMIGLFSLGVKFQCLAAFGIALAVAATMFRGPGTVMVTRALNARHQDRLALQSAEPIAQD